MRTVIAIGSRHRDVIRLARFCAWGNHWMSPEDHVLHSLGAPTTRGCCDEHVAEMERGPVLPRGAA